MLSKSTFQTKHRVNARIPSRPGLQLTAVCPHYLSMSCQAFLWLLEIQKEILRALTERGHHSMMFWKMMFYVFSFSIQMDHIVHLTYVTTSLLKWSFILLIDTILS